MYLGVDLGTSALKAVLVDERQAVVAASSVGLTVERPQPLWAEQHPAAWWAALVTAVAQLRGQLPTEFAAIEAIGLTGQMHGATLLDAADRVLRPCILWNDGRSGAECAALEAREPRLRQITGNQAMPGFTAPKLLWVARHEPETFSRLRSVLLPKDYLRLRLTGTKASDTSDAAGTLWLDVAARRWSPFALAATGLDQAAMPELFEGNAISGRLLPALAQAWGLRRETIIAAGAGDNAAAAIGLGLIEPGDGFVSLGTSGVVFEVDAGFNPAPERGVHT